MTKTIASLGLALALAASAGCSNDTASLTVMGKTLTVKEQNYGTADYYCGNLANGEIMVVLTDFALCDGLKPDGGATGGFHAQDGSNLRIIFPSTLKQFPNANTFTVGTSNCVDQIGANTQAVAYFAHNAGSAYDVSVQADSGQVHVNYTDYNPKAGEIKGSYDLHFGGDHVTGAFDALFCAGIKPGSGK